MAPSLATLMAVWSSLARRRVARCIARGHDRLIARAERRQTDEQCEQAQEHAPDPEAEAVFAPRGVRLDLRSRGWCDGVHDLLRVSFP